MDKLCISKTKYTPEVCMDSATRTVSFTGNCYPENAAEFFVPIFDWLREYVKQFERIEVDFKVNYFNTSSSKCFLIILEILEEFASSNGKVMVNWYYREDDEDMLESGEELFFGINLPHKVIPFIE